MGAPHIYNLCCTAALRWRRMEEVLTAALSPDNAVRRRAEEQLGYANSQRGFAVALAKKLSTSSAVPDATGGLSTMDGGEAISGLDGTLPGSSMMDTPTRLMAGMLLQKFVRDRWSRTSPALLPPEDKAQVSQTAVFRHRFGFQYQPLLRASLYLSLWPVSSFSLFAAVCMSACMPFEETRRTC